MFPCHLTILQAKGLLRIASHPKLARGWMDLTEGFQLALAFYDLQMVWRHMCAWQKTQQLENIHHALTFSQANVFSTNVIQLTGLFVLLLYFCHPSGSSVGWSEKHKSLKIQKYRADSQHWFQNNFWNHDWMVRLARNWANVFYRKRSSFGTL